MFDIKWEALHMMVLKAVLTMLGVLLAMVGLSQQELADRLGVSRQTINAIGKELQDCASASDGCWV